jgi:hypothetical protein
MNYFVSETSYISARRAAAGKETANEGRGFRKTLVAFGFVGRRVSLYAHFRPGPGTCCRGRIPGVDRRLGTPVIRMGFKKAYGVKVALAAIPNHWGR